jgi:hypothetical protein
MQQTPWTVRLWFRNTAVLKNSCNDYVSECIRVLNKLPNVV